MANVLRHITIKTSRGNIAPIMYNSTDPYRLYYMGEFCYAEQKLKDICLWKDTTMALVIDKGTMQITINLANERKSVKLASIYVFPTETNPICISETYDCRRYVSFFLPSQPDLFLKGILVPSKGRLTFAGQVLECDKTLAFYHIHNGRPRSHRLMAKMSLYHAPLLALTLKRK